MQSHIVIGLGYGDEGKGTWVDSLVREHGISHVVRFNGGAQALHHVTSPDGLVHGFSQFSAGTLVPGTCTCLSRFMLIEPEAVFAEARVLESKGIEAPLTRLIVSENAPVITPHNRLLNQMKETFRSNDRHGSCGFGIGITQEDIVRFGDEALYVRDLNDDTVYEKLLRLGEDKIEQAKSFVSDKTLALYEQLVHTDIEYYCDLFMEFYDSVTVLTEKEFQKLLATHSTVFEGAQGVLLDEFLGTFPHCTRSVCTFQNAETLLRESAFSGSVKRIGLLRGYGHRHGAGPFVTEEQGIPISQCHNGNNKWQGEFRLGWFDVVSARYALEVVEGVDTLAITNMDRLLDIGNIKICTSYDNVDNRYVTNERIVPLYGDYPKLAEQTETLFRAKPLYEDYGSLHSDKDIVQYLERLSELIEHPINAYSVSPDYSKVILQKHENPSGKLCACA